MNRASYLVVAVAVAATLSISACESSSSGGGGSSSSGEIDLFGINPMTGQSAPYGTRAQQGAELAVDELTAAGGVTDSCGNKHSIKISRNDMGDDPKQAITLTRTAAQDKSVTAIIGPAPSTAFVPMVPLAGSLKIPVIATGSGAAIDKWNKYAFRVNAVSTLADAKMMKDLAGKFSVKRVALMYQSDNQGQTSGAKAIQDAASSLGYQVVDVETFRANEQNFSAQLTKIAAAHPDWIGIYGEGPEAAPITLQARQMNITAHLFYGIGAIPLDPKMWDLSQGTMKGGYTWTDALVGSSSTGAGAEFTAKYKAKFSDDPTAWSIYGYYAVGTIVEAVKKACTTTDRDKLASTLGSTSYTAPDGGTVVFKNPPNGENQNPPIYVTQTTGKGQFDILFHP